MRRVKYLLAAVMLFGSIIFSSVPPAYAAETNVYDLSAMDFAESLGVGWNLGNSLDAYDETGSSETAWNNPAVTKELIQAVADAGFKTVRIPVTWFGHIGDKSSGYMIETAWLDRVEEIVSWVKEAGMYAIINIHHDGNNDVGNAWLYLEDYDYFSENWQWVTWVDDTVLQEIRQENIREKFTAVWEQIADRFRNYDGHLIFEGMNEMNELWNYGDPSLETSIENLNALNQIFVDTVRSSGGNNANRFLLISGYNTNIWITAQYQFDSGTAFKMPVDTAQDKLMLSVHFYDPYDYVLNETETVYKWGQEVLDLGAAASDSWGMEDYVKQAMDTLDVFLDKGIPVIIGEYGNIDKSHVDPVATEYRRYYLEYITNTMLNYRAGIVPVYWDNGYSGDYGFALFDRNTAQQIEPDLINAVIRGQTNTVRTLFSIEMFEDTYGFYDQSKYTTASWALYENAYQTALSAAADYRTGISSGTADLALLESAELAYLDLKDAVAALEPGVPDAPAIAGISIYSEPDKTTYQIGEKIDLTGSQIKVSYSDNTEKILDVSDDMIGAYDFSKAGEQTIVVSYGGYEAMFNVTVTTAADKEETPKINEVSDVKAAPDNKDHIAGTVAARTGDSAPISALIAAMVISTGIISFIVIKKRKSK